MKGDEYKSKIKALELVDSYWNKQKKYCMKKWQQNTNRLKLRDNSRRHLLTSLGNIHKLHQGKKVSEQVISKFEANKDEALKIKKQIRTMAVLKTLDQQDMFRRTMLNETIDKLKYNHYRGNFLKNLIFHKFLREKIGNVNKCLNIWNGVAKQAK